MLRLYNWTEDSIHRPTSSWPKAVAWPRAFIPLQIEMTFIQCYHRFYSVVAICKSFIVAWSTFDILYSNLFIANCLNLLYFNKILLLLHVYHCHVYELFKILCFGKITMFFKVIIRYSLIITWIKSYKILVIKYLILWTAQHFLVSLRDILFKRRGKIQIIAQLIGTVCAGVNGDLSKLDSW